jgi:nucleoprotein TPR
MNYAQKSPDKELLGSVQRIEASLAAKSEGERDHLEKEVHRLNEKMASDEEKYSENVKKLEGKVADLEISVQNLTAQKETATENASKANNEVSQSKVKIQEITREFELKL